MQDIRPTNKTATAAARLESALMRHKRDPLNRHPEELGALLAPSVSKGDSPDRPRPPAPPSFEARSLMLARASG
jgi:hypothetical protein